jgi:hypothetical protein
MLPARLSLSPDSSWLSVGCGIDGCGASRSDARAAHVGADAHGEDVSDSAPSSMLLPAWCSSCRRGRAWDGLDREVTRACRRTPARSPAPPAPASGEPARHTPPPATLSSPPTNRPTATPGSRSTSVVSPPSPRTPPPGQRARAEATWRPNPADQPCRCSGGCHHGQPCDLTDGCAGGLIRTDRHPGRRRASSHARSAAEECRTPPTSGDLPRSRRGRSWGPGNIHDGSSAKVLFRAAQLEENRRRYR